MSDQAFSGQMTSLGETLSSWQPRGKLILGASMLFMAAAIVSPVIVVKLTFLLVSGVLLVAWAAALFGPAALDRWRQFRLTRHLRLLDVDPCPVVVTGPDDSVLYTNSVAKQEFAARPTMALADVLQGVVADPHSIITRASEHLKKDQNFNHKIRRLTGDIDVKVMALDGGLTAWRLTVEDGRLSNDTTLPTVTLSQDDTVVHANEEARALLGAHADALALFCPKPPLQPGAINELRTAGGLLPCFVHELDGHAPKVSGSTRDIALIPAGDVMAQPSDTWSVLETLPVALLRLSADGVIELSNRPARAILGVESGAGRRLSELMDGPGRPVTDWLHDAVDGRGTVQPEILQLRRKDKDVFVQVALSPVRDGGRTVLIAVLQDATKLKSLELQFVQSQKMQAIGQLAGGVAHDFNNLLTAISGHCDLLLMRHGVDDPTYPDLMQISQNANRAAALVGQLLAYSRKQMLRLEIMSLRDMLSDVTHLLNRLVGEKVVLRLDHDPDIAPDLWSVRADKRQLEQVLMNLVVNARDAMPDGGEVVIRTKNCLLEAPLKRDQAEVAPGRYVVVSVEDQGVGIPEDFIDKVFEPFYTSKKQGEGTGLGLSTAYGIVKQTGGFIFVDSVPGQGACFQIYLPAHNVASQPTDRARVPKAQVQPSSGVVMLVEDEAPVRAFACRALKMKGFSVIEASSGEDALKLLEDDALHVDVVVTDVVMPGMDGPTWVAKALKTRPKTRVIFVSGYAADSIEGGPMPGDASVFLPKPFSLTELVETVQAQVPASETV
ncbi:MAG: ATP-binding protein [Pseudomonadota bacterium]